MGDSFRGYHVTFGGSHQSTDARNNSSRHNTSTGNTRTARNTNTNQDKTDAELVAEYLRGNARAFNDIVDRHRGQLRAVARKYASNPQDTEDIVQEAWLKASTSLHTFRAEAKLSTWLHRIAANQGYDHLNARTSREKPTLDEDDNRDLRARLATTPHDAVDDAILIRQALAELPPAQRAAVVLVDAAGYSVDDAAAELGTKPGTIKSRRARARQVLQDSPAYRTL